MNPTAVRGAAAADQRSPSASPTSPSFTAALRNWSAIMSLLMVEQMNRRTRSGRFGLIIIIAEPFALVLTFYWIHGMLKGVVQPYGESLFLFLVSGLLPFYLFMRTSIRSRVGRVDTGRRLPRITSLDIFMAGAAAQTAIWIPVIGATFVGMWLYGIDQARPVSVSTCLTALLFLALLGTGLGLINFVIGRFMPVWPIIIGLATRGMIFLSGVIHIPDFFYPSVRTWLAWNPILHGIDWFRLGVYGRYPVLLLDQFYLVKCAVILLFIGLVADRATLRYGARDN